MQKNYYESKPYYCIQCKKDIKNKDHLKIYYGLYQFYHRGQRLNAYITQGTLRENLVDVKDGMLEENDLSFSAYCSMKCFEERIKDRKYYAEQSFDDKSFVPKTVNNFFNDDENLEKPSNLKKEELVAAIMQIPKEPEKKRGRPKEIKEVPEDEIKKILREDVVYWTEQGVPSITAIIKTIADEYGVAPMTVKGILDGNKPQKKTRERIMNIVNTRK
jgi:hypothetical protein